MSGPPPQTKKTATTRSTPATGRLGERGSFGAAAGDCTGRERFESAEGESLAPPRRALLALSLAARRCACARV